MRKLILTGVAASTLMAASLALAPAAQATSGGYYKTSTACNQAGHNIVDRPGSQFSSWTCKNVGGSAPWHLILS